MTLQKLGDICEFKYGKSLPAKVRKKGSYHVYGSNGAVGSHEEAITAGPTLIVGRKGSIGEVIFSEQECWPIDTTYFVDETSTKENLRWLFYALKNLHLQRLNKSTGVPGLNRNDAYEKELIVPSPDEQKRIAGILDQADALYRSRGRAISGLNDLSHSIFNEMFGDPVHNEKKWNVEKLDDLTTKISSGSTPKGGSKNYVEQGIVFLRSQNVWRNRLELDDVAYIDEATHQKMKKSSLKNGDILITKTGRINTENSSLGRAAMFLGEDDSANVNGHVYLIRPKPAVLKEFILYIMTTPEYREYIRSVCVGGIDKRQINKEHLEEFPIIYPPIEEQKKFLKKLKTIEEQKARFTEQLDLAENLFLSLQQRAFNGEL